MQDGPTVLVAHSYGGMVISEVNVHPKVSKLVYVAARAGCRRKLRGAYEKISRGARECRPRDDGRLSAAEPGSFPQ